MGCATSTLKFLSILCNILCFLFGGMMISASAYALVAFETSEAIRLPCIIGIVMGSLLFLATIFGCCGAYRNSVRLTWTYAALLLVLMGCQIAIIFLQPVDFKNLASDTVNNAWNRELTEHHVMEGYERAYDCCGKTGPSNYLDSGMAIPGSCYVHQNSTSSADLYTEGCVAKLAEAFSSSARIEVISDWSLVAVEAFTILITCMLAISLRNTKRRELYR